MLERDRLMTENAVAKEKLAKELGDRKAELERATLRGEELKSAISRELEQARQQAELDTARLRIEADRLTAEAAIAKANGEIQSSRIRMEEIAARTEISKLGIQIERKEKQMEASGM